MRGYGVRYYRISSLFLALTQAKIDGSYRKLLAKLARAGLLIIDDWGLEKLRSLAIIIYLFQACGKSI